jgi:hypothetical protein
LNGKITILGFSGSDILKIEKFFNLNEKVYQRYHTFKSLQFVMVCPLGTEMILKIYRCLDEFTDVSQWHFVFTTPKEINSYYDSLNLKEAGP